MPLGKKPRNTAPMNDLLFPLSGMKSQILGIIHLVFMWHALNILEGANMHAPSWCQQAVWYQIFPERFANGAPSNDLVRESLHGTWPYLVPMVWPDVAHDPESTHPLSASRVPEPVYFHEELHAFYQNAIQMRRKEPCLNQGDFEFLSTDAGQRWMVCKRTHGTESVIGIFNAGNTKLNLDLNTIGLPGTPQAWKTILGQPFNEDLITLAGQSFMILKKQP
jgi:glycosidase